MNMRRLIGLFLLAALLCGCAQAPAPVRAGREPAEVAASVEEAALSVFAEYPSDGRMIAPEVVLFRAEEGEDLFLVDLRSRGDYDAGHIRGAVSIPWGADFARQMKNLPRDREIIVYCHSGQHAAQAVSLMKAAGLEGRSMQYGFGFGFSRVPGYERAVDTQEVALEEKDDPLDPELQAALGRYFEEMDAAAQEGFLYFLLPEATLKSWTDEKRGGFFLLDIRAQAHHEEGHIQGTDLRLDFGAGMQEQFGRIPKDRLVVVYCYSGQTSGQLLAVLRLLGYEALSLTGGMGTPGNSPIGWLNRGFPLVR